MNSKNQYFANNQPIQQLDAETQEKVRSQAYLRQAPYNHQTLSVEHEPINAKQCLQLQRQLKGLTVSKVDQIKNHEADLLAHDSVLNYDQNYFQLMNKDMYNENKLKNTYEDIREMHNIADMLLQTNNIWQSGELYLHQRHKTYDLNREQQFEQIYKKYRDAYQAEQKVDDGMAEDAINRAKRFLLKDYQQFSQ